MVCDDGQECADEGVIADSANRGRVYGKHTKNL
jgi:hypothetical protein